MFTILKPKYGLCLRAPIRIFLILAYLLFAVLAFFGGYYGVRSVLLLAIIPALMLLIFKNHAELALIPLAFQSAVSVFNILFNLGDIFPLRFFNLVQYASLAMTVLLLGLILLSMYSELSIDLVKLCAAACLIAVFASSFFMLDNNGLSVFTGLNNVISMPMIYLYSALPYIMCLLLKKTRDQKVNLLLILIIVIIIGVIFCVSFSSSNKESDEADVPHLTKCYNCNGRGEYEIYRSCNNCYGEGLIHDPCHNCDGKGSYTELNNETCWECNGNGEFEETCPDCGGNGGWDNYYGFETCYSCDGNGTLRRLCNNCGGAGSQSVEVTNDCGVCEGRGHIDSHCSNCEGRGNYREYYFCNACNGSGKTNSSVIQQSTRGEETYRADEYHGH